jgi:hypothetical protein|tara:strand:- start:204 stop:1136 length:933 start_codon:yes stop_codon:yes gene_type:complete
MELIEGVALSKLCDYSFGDQSGQWGNIYTSFMKDANFLNTEFATKVFEVMQTRDYMTVFIDNIRLYKRQIESVKPEDKRYVNALMARSDLLDLCSNFPQMKFIIFTNLEDTPIDDFILNKIPENVACISAVNAITHNDKVIPAPYGVQRRMNPSDDRIEQLTQYMEHVPSKPRNLLYVSHNESSNVKRMGIKSLFYDKDWAEVNEQRVPYNIFLYNLSGSKFMICPIGNAIDCHRNWEVLYMRRVPIMTRDPYLQKLFENYPVLFVDKYSDITEELLLANDHLFQKAQTMDLSGLTLPTFFDRIVEKALK